jgi:hypothetical protein
MFEFNDFNALLHFNILNAKQMRFQLELMLLGMIEPNQPPEMFKTRPL